MEGRDLIYIKSKIILQYHNTLNRRNDITHENFKKYKHMLVLFVWFNPLAPCVTVTLQKSLFFQ